MTQIALFGTSADPPSIAHREILRWLCDRYDWVAVWASDNPMKPQQTPPPASLGHAKTDGGGITSNPSQRRDSPL